MSRDMHNFIEDVPSRPRTYGAHERPLRGHPTCVRNFAACRDANASRTYRALTVELRRQLASAGRQRQLHVEPLRGELLTSTTPRRVFQHVVVHSGWPGADVQDPESVSARCSRTGRTSFTLFGTFAATLEADSVGYSARAESGAPWAGARARTWRRHLTHPTGRDSHPQPHLDNSWI
jgi:hypothetical protein